METLTETTPPEPAGPQSSGSLLNRNFVLLWTGQTVSQLGNQAFSIAMMFWTMEATGSASLMGLMMTFANLPAVLLGPIGGTFADRHSRIRIIVVGDLIAGLSVCGLALSLWAMPEAGKALAGGGMSPATRAVIGLLFGVAVLLGTIRAFFLPAVAATIPRLVPTEKLAAANSLNQLAIQASVFAGQAAGGVLFKVFGAPLLFLFDGLSYLFAGACALFIPRDQVQPAPATEEVHPFRHFLRETAEGFRFIWKRKGLRDFVVIASVNNFLSMPVLVLLPFYVTKYLNREAEWYGFLLAGVSVGTVLGFILAGTLRLAGRARMRLIVAAMILYSVFFSSLAFVRIPPVALVVMILGGITVGIINVFLITMIQRATPETMLGRVMGVIQALSGGLMPLGMALGGVIGDLTDKNVPLVVMICGSLALVATLLLGTRRDCREFLANG